MAAVKSLLHSLQWLQDFGEYSDLSLVCGKETFHVHKAIVCSRSKWFRTACAWGKEDEKPKKELNLDGDDPVVVGLMIDYLYQTDYDDNTPSRRAGEIDIEALEATGPAAVDAAVQYRGFGHATVGDPQSLDTLQWQFNDSTAAPDEDEWGTLRTSVKRKKMRGLLEQEISYQESDDINLNEQRLSVNALMYALADKYEIDDLKDRAKTKFEQAASERISAQVFAHAAHLVFSTTPSLDEGLRTIVVRTLSQNRELIRYEGITNLIDSPNGMARLLIEALL